MSGGYNAEEGKNFWLVLETSVQGRDGGSSSYPVATPGM